MSAAQQQPMPWVVPGAAPAPPKKAYENKPMPPPGIGYVGAVMSQGVTHKPGKSSKFWVKAQVRQGDKVYEAFVDIHDTERSRDLYLPTWCHAFGIPEPVTQDDKKSCGDALFSNQIRHKGATVCFDVEASDRPKQDGTPYYVAVNPRRPGEPTRERRPYGTVKDPGAPAGSPAIAPGAVVSATNGWPVQAPPTVTPPTAHVVSAAPPAAPQGNWFTGGPK